MNSSKKAISRPRAPLRYVRRSDVEYNGMGQRDAGGQPGKAKKEDRKTSGGVRAVKFAPMER